MHDANTDAIKQLSNCKCEVRNTKIGPCATRAPAACVRNMAWEVVKLGT
jgi:hypothetical protein